MTRDEAAWAAIVSPPMIQAAIVRAPRAAIFVFFYTRGESARAAIAWSPTLRAAIVRGPIMQAAIVRGPIMQTAIARGLIK